jgi:ketosteroid isomerase-like protein
MSELAAGQAPGVDTVHRLFDAFNSRDPEAGLTLLSPEIVFEPVSSVVMNDGEPYRGHEGVRRYLHDVAEHWQTLTVHPVQIRAAGTAVVALGQVSGLGLGGPLVDAPTTWVFKFKDELVVHVQVFSDERLARQALERETEG